MDEKQEGTSEQDQQELSKQAKQRRANNARRAREQAMRDLGLTKVRGNLGGTYWE